MEQEYYRMPRRRLTRTRPGSSARPSNCIASCTPTLAPLMIGRSNSRAPRSTRPSSAACSTNCRTKWSALGTGRDASNSPPHIESDNQQTLNKHVGRQPTEVHRSLLGTLAFVPCSDYEPLVRPTGVHRLWILGGLAEPLGHDDVFRRRSSKPPSLQEGRREFAE